MGIGPNVTSNIYMHQLYSNVINHNMSSYTMQEKIGILTIKYPNGDVNPVKPGPSNNWQKILIS